MAVDFIRMIRDDMDLFHDGPSGVLEVLNGWGSGAQTPAANAKPSGWSAYVMWGHLMRDATGAVASLSPTDAARPWRDSRTRTGNRASNTRVQLNHQQIVWLLSNGSWQLGEYRNWLKPVLYPFNWTEGTEINMPLPNYRQTEPLGGSSMRALSLANDSRNPANPNQYRDRTWHPFGDRQVVPANFVGWVSCFFGRLIVDDPLLPDDRAQANLLGGCAHDWYLAMDLGGVPPTAEVNVTNAGWSRLKYLTNDWQLFAHTNLSESTLRGNPPPLTGLSLLEPTAVPANTRIFPATVARSVAQAVSSAGAGGKRLAGAQALVAAIGSNPRLKLRRVGSPVLDVALQGTLTASATGISVTSYTSLLTLVNADADTPAYSGGIDPAGWVMRLGRADDSVYIEGPVGPASSSAPFRLSNDLNTSKGVAITVSLGFDPSVDG